MMDDTNNTPTPPAAPPAPPAAPAGSGDITALQAQVSGLQKQVEDLGKARAGAQQLAAQKDQQLQDVSTQLTNLQQLLNSAQQELETTKAAKTEAATQLEQFQSTATQAQRQAQVLTLAAQNQPLLVQAIAGGFLTISGQTDEEIVTSLGQAAALVKAINNQGTGQAPAQGGTETPPPPALPLGGNLPVPSEGDVRAQIQKLLDEKARYVAGEYPDWDRVHEFDRKIAELQAKLT